MGRGAVKIPVEGEMNTVSVFELENSKIHGHRLSSFLPPGGEVIRLPQGFVCDGQQACHIGKCEAAGGSTQAIVSSGPHHTNTIFQIRSIQFQVPLHMQTFLQS